MAMIFLDGFDYLTAANFNLKWDSFGGASLQTGVYGIGQATGLGTGTKTLGSNFVTGFQGFHYFTGTLAANTPMCRFNDAGTIQVELRMDATGGLFFVRGTTSIGSTSTSRLLPNTWYFIEAKATIDPSAGEASVSVNGVAFLTQTGLNTRNSANSFFNQVVITGGGGGTQQADSYHFWDTTAGDVTTFFGEHIIDTRLANAAGTNTTWTIGGSSPAATNWQSVNEAHEDADVTFVSTLTVNNIDSYKFVNVATVTGTIATIAIDTICRVDDGLAHVIDHYSLSGGVVGLSAGVSPATTYQNRQTFQGTDPNTAAAWTIAGRNLAEFGYKFIS